MKKKFLVTGGAGFIGSHLVDSLLADGNSVMVIDDFSTGRLENLDAAKKNTRLQILKADISASPDVVSRAVEVSDVVVHLAAAVGVDLVVNSPVRTIRTNVEGTFNVLEPAAKFKRRIVIASTSEVYGKSTQERFQEFDDLRLGSPYHSRWSYACSKLIDEFLLMAHVQDGGLPGTVVRFFNTVGPRQSGRYGMVVPRFVRSALEGSPVRVFGDGEQTRCFCHVSDTVRALRMLIDNDASIGGIYNIGSDELISMRDLASKVISRFGSESKIEFVPYDVAYAKGFEDMRHRRPSTEALRKLTGWKPRHDLDSILDDVAAYIRNTPQE
ncbi:MAG: GDP-mannose 4,6-dehydratase [Victivallaceae bacterium]|nr:GDP-mannose 4,6-dehydratase [Victivallaceae bacterium]